MNPVEPTLEFHPAAQLQLITKKTKESFNVYPFYMRKTKNAINKISQTLHFKYPNSEKIVSTG